MDAKQALALFALADQVRASARAAIAQLKNLGISPVMITGDAEAVAATVATELGIERYYARVLPQDKAKIVRELKASGQTAFVGDGSTMRQPSRKPTWVWQSRGHQYSDRIRRPGAGGK